MTENKRLIQGIPSARRYLHSDEIFLKERNWNINLPSEREFKNGYGIITDKNDTAYSIDELIELLNEFQKENKQLKQQLEYIQNSISEHIKHQKTELGQKALKEIIKDYNEWLLGLKE